MNKLNLKLVLGLLLTINFAFANSTTPNSGIQSKSQGVNGVFAQYGNAFNSWLVNASYSPFIFGTKRICDDPLPYLISSADAYNDGQGTSSGVLCSNPWDYDNYFNIVTYQLNAYPAYPLTLNWGLYGPTGLLTSGSFTVSSSAGYFTLPGYPAGSGYSVVMTLTGGPCNQTSEYYEISLEYVNCN